MSNSLNLLRAAARVLGGPGALAERLGIDESLIQCFMSGQRRVPDALVLRVVDLLEEQRRASASHVTYQPRRALSAVASAPLESGDAHGTASKEGAA